MPALHGDADILPCGGGIREVISVPLAVIASKGAQSFDQTRVIRGILLKNVVFTVAIVRGNGFACQGLDVGLGEDLQVARIVVP